MERQIRCSNEECTSNTEGDEPVFSATLTVDQLGVACTSAYELPGECFTCCLCESDGEWVERIVKGE